MTDTIFIEKSWRPAALAALYNESKPQGMGFLQFDPEMMTPMEAETLLENSPYFDYLKGRIMKIGLTDEGTGTPLYDRDNGEGACERALERHDIPFTTGEPTG